MKSIPTLLYISFRDLLLTLSSRSFFTCLCMSWSNSFCRHLCFSSTGWCMALFLSFPENLVLKKNELIQWSVAEVVGGHWSPRPLYTFNSAALKHSVAASPTSRALWVLLSGYSCVPWINLFSWGRVVSCNRSEWKSYSLEQKRLKMKLLIVTAGDFFLCIAASWEHSQLPSEVWEGPCLLSAPPWVRTAVVQLFSIISVLQWVGRY